MFFDERKAKKEYEHLHNLYLQIATYPDCLSRDIAFGITYQLMHALLMCEKVKKAQAVKIPDRMLGYTMATSKKNRGKKP